MLREWEINLECIEDGGSSVSIAEAFHGWMFTNIQHLSAEVSENWHRATIKPFRIKLDKPYPYGHRFRKRDRILVYLTALTAEACELFSMLLQDTRKVRLGNTWFAVENVVVIRSTTYELLINEAFSTIHHRWRRFEFQTPTVIRSDGKNILFPAPEKVFSSLSRRFHESASVELPTLHADWAQWIDGNRYQLQTSAVRFSTHHMIGFTGDIHYRFHKHMPIYERSLFHLLSEFATYSGVGHKTTMGMGATVTSEVGVVVD